MADGGKEAEAKKVSATRRPNGRLLAVIFERPSYRCEKEGRGALGKAPAVWRSGSSPPLIPSQKTKDKLGRSMAQDTGLVAPDHCSSTGPPRVAASNEPNRGLRIPLRKRANRGNP